MKLKYYSAILCLMVAVALGCDTNPAADAERNRTQREADRVRQQHDDQAEAIRDADGRTILGEAQTREGERLADAVEDVGDRRADAVEEGGERRADEIERQDRNSTRDGDGLRDPGLPRDDFTPN